MGACINGHAIQSLDFPTMDRSTTAAASTCTTPRRLRSRRCSPGSEATPRRVPAASVCFLSVLRTRCETESCSWTGRAGAVSLPVVSSMRAYTHGTGDGATTGLFPRAAGGGARRAPAHPLVGGSSGVYGCVCERERRQWSMLPTQRANALTQRLDSHGICCRRTGE